MQTSQRRWWVPLIGLLGLMIAGLLVSPLAAGPVRAADRWQPGVGISWEIQLNSVPQADEVLAGLDAYDIDLFEAIEHPERVDAIVATDAKLICYFSAGSWEKWRPDAADFPAAAVGNKLAGWPGEKWLDVRDPEVQAIMRARLDLAQELGCDAVDPDNVDGYNHNTGFDLSRGDLIAYLTMLADEAHARGMAIGLKNGLEMVDDLVGLYDFSVNEQCFQYRECSRLDPFIDAGKPVLNIEYGDFKQKAKQVCPKANERQFSTLIKRLALDSRRRAC